MTHYVIFKYSEDDVVNLTIDGSDVQEIVFLDARTEDQYVHTDVKKLAARIPLTSFQSELAYFACAIYSADRRILREHAYDSWTRDIHVYFPAIAIEKWESVQDALTSALSFLSGDKWAITFYPTSYRHNSEERVVDKEIINIDLVELLSGGLDSFIGAVDLLESHDNGIMFVSHYPSGSPERKFQEKVVQFLEEKYPNKVDHIGLYVQPHRGLSGLEKSSRSRSFMFIMLGMTVAEALGCSSLVMTENGFMSLNVPLTSARIGSLSTRTTQPYFLDLIRELVKALGISVSLVTPYQFKTKGEMITGSRNIDAVRDGYLFTRSCATTGERGKGYSTKIHCGKCFPCIVRRAALHKAGFHLDKYNTDNLDVGEIGGKTFQDLWAARAMVHKYRSKAPTIFDIIGNAPVSRDIDDFLGVFTRGIEELASFLKT